MKKKFGQINHVILFLRVYTFNIFDFPHFMECMVKGKKYA